jgi:cellulose biosynthesis protein BcsQ
VRKENGWSVDALTVRQLTGRGVGRELVEMAEEFDFVLADCPGMHAGELSIAVCASHLVVVPARPGLFDAVGLESIVDVLGQTVARSVEGRRVMIVLSQMPTARNSRDVRELRELLGQDTNAKDFELLKMKVADTEIQARVAYPRATERGQGVGEWNDPAARGQVRRLVDELLDELSEEEGGEA